MNLKYLVVLFAFCRCGSQDAPMRSDAASEQQQVVALETRKQDQSASLPPGIPFMGNYVPKSLPFYKLVPERVRKSVESEIIGQTGIDFFKKLQYIGGGFVDLDSLYKIEVDAKSYNWKPSSYYLCFQLSDTASDVSYFSTVETDINGHILNGIEFPDITRHPEKAILISKRDAIKIATENNVINSSQSKYLGISTDINLTFDTRRKIFTWEFERAFDTAGHADFAIHYYRINAHNGKFIGHTIGMGIH